MAEVNNNFSGANFPGVTNFGVNSGTQIGTQHNYAPEQNLVDAAKDIQDLLVFLQQTNPTITEAEKQAAIIKKVEQQIKQNPTLRDRLLNALKQGGIEALKQALDAVYKNPVVSISVETVKGFLEAEARE